MREDAGGTGLFASSPAAAVRNSLLFSLLAGNNRGEGFVADCAHRQAHGSRPFAVLRCHSSNCLETQLYKALSRRSGPAYVR